MKRFLTALSLTILLSASALAGEIPTVGLVPPVPPATTQPQNGVSGEVPTGGLAQFADDLMLTIISMLAS